MPPITAHEDVQVMILAAGLGTRLWPLTAQRAKPAIPFLGKALVRHCAELAEAHGFSNIVVNTHYQPDSVRRALLGLNVKFSHETEILGTAGALRHALDQGLLDQERSTLIINGKLFTDIDLSAALEVHRKQRAEVTMILRENSKREAFREVLCDDHVITGFGPDRQTHGDNPLLFTGIHLMSPHVLKTIPTGCSDTIRDTYPPFIADGKVVGYCDHSPRWWEFSTLKRYVELHRHAHVENIGPENTIAEDAQVDDTAKLENCILWPGAQVGAECQLKDVVLGNDVCLSSHSQLEQTVVMHKTELKTIERGEIIGNYVYVPLA